MPLGLVELGCCFGSRVREHCIQWITGLSGLTSVSTVFVCSGVGAAYASGSRLMLLRVGSTHCYCQSSISTLVEEGVFTVVLTEQWLGRLC